MRTVIFALALLAAGCDRPDDAQRILLNAGYTQVQTTGWRAFQCSKDDTFSTGFKAKGPTGRDVTGTVCSNFIVKGGTIRLD